MNAVEIEEAVSRLVEQSFDAEKFPFDFLEAFGNKPTTIKKLQTGTSNQSNIPGGVLHRSNIHLGVCADGEVTATLNALRESSATVRLKAKFILATDGKFLEAERLSDGRTVACEFADFPNHFGLFLPLAGISTVERIDENAFDIKATGRLNRLYIELLKDNPEWATAARREELNHFMARLIFCFFAEDTAIFGDRARFTATIEQMTKGAPEITHEVLSELFRAMCTKLNDRELDGIKSWANDFPYVNGGLFSGSVEVPKFSKIARSYLLHVGNLDWTKINPDIFGSMIQAVADDEERGALGLHYTNVPNILKVLNPLFLDDLRAKLEEAGDGQTSGSARRLLNLRRRLVRIRVFDPACGSGNFLVIGYKEMRAIEAEINRRRGETDRKSDIPLTNFRGIEIRHFSCEIARLALIIAEYQCDVLYRGQPLALAEFLPLEAANWITCGNALRLDWLSLCPPTGKGVKNRADDLFETPLDQAEIDFENEGGETYICGNPPYLGSTWQSKEQKAEIKGIFEGRTKTFGLLDYVAGWFMKAADYGTHTQSAAAFVSTNSICQGQQVPILWPLVFLTGHAIHFAHTSFKWANLASHNAGVTVVIVGISNHPDKVRRLFSMDDQGNVVLRKSENINAYLVSGMNVIVEKASKSKVGLAPMDYGNKPTDDGGLILYPSEYAEMKKELPSKCRILRRFIGSNDAIDGSLRYCLWISDAEAKTAAKIDRVSNRMDSVRKFRLASSKEATVESAKWPYRFQEIRQTGSEVSVVIPRHSSEIRHYLPFSLGGEGAIVADSAFAFYDASWWNVSIFASRLHLIWIATVCGKLETRYRYSNTLGWNTFPVPTLTDQNKADLTRCAEEILLAREAHFPATIANLYDPEMMPADLCVAHERNDETLERIYIGRRFKNDTERLEKLFELYVQMTAKQPTTRTSRK